MQAAELLRTSVSSLLLLQYERRLAHAEPEAAGLKLPGTSSLQSPAWFAATKALICQRELRHICRSRVIMPYLSPGAGLFSRNRSILRWRAYDVPALVAGSRR